MSYSGPFLAGVVFEVTTSGMWFDGYWWWVCDTGQSTDPVECALWSATSSGTGVVLQAATVTSSPLTAGQWNFIPLSEPVPIAIGSPYIAAIGVNGSFPCTNDIFGAGDAYAAGIVNGPLTAYSDTSGSAPAPYGLVQGVFTATGSDPTISLPNGESNSANFWVDVQVSNATPSGYVGSYRLWPNKWDANPYTSADSPVNYVVATEFRLSETCTLNNVWYYSPPGGTEQLATRCDIYDIATQQSVASILSPNWSGTAGSGWVSAAFTEVIAVPAGHYKIAIFNDSAVPDGWSAKDDTTEYWASGVGANGITSGPLYAPYLSAASSAYVLDNDGASNTPPYSDGQGTQEPGQATFAIGGPQYPYLYVDGKAQNYWVDIEVSPGGTPISIGPPPPAVDSAAFLSFFG